MLRPNKHLAFGHGIRRCVGAPLARLEFDVIVSAVLQRMPDYCIDHEATHNYPDLGLMYGYQRMPIRFTPKGRRLYSGLVTLHGCSVDDTTAREQYRLFSVYSWIAATSTAAMGSKWQPIEIARHAMIRPTESVEHLDAVGLLEERLGFR